MVKSSEPNAGDVTRKIGPLYFTHWNEIVHRFKILLYPLEFLSIKYLKEIEKANQGHEGQIKGRIGKKLCIFIFCFNMIKWS